MSIDHEELERLDALRTELNTFERRGYVFTDAQDMSTWAGSIAFVQTTDSIYNPYYDMFPHRDPNNIEYYTTPRQESIVGTIYHEGPMLSNMHISTGFISAPSPSVIVSRPPEGKSSIIKRLKELISGLNIISRSRR